MNRIASAAAAALLLLGLAATAAPASATAAPAVRVHGFRADPSARMPPTHLFERKSAKGSAITSSNWSGYADQACGTCALRYVAASFSIPSVNCAQSLPGAYVSEWVGLDGLADGTVEQTGIDATCIGGQPVYYAWYEMYPAAPVVFTAPMNPGDAITAAVYWDAAAGLYDLALDDVTAGDSLAATQSCATSSCANASAEVVTEAPSSAGGTLPLADYGQAGYVGAQVTSRNGTHGYLAPNGLWSTWALVMDDPSGQTSTPGAAEGGQAFLTTWAAS